MLVFIDESGDPGFKTEKGSSSHFVIALVIFDDELDAEETALKIKKFRRDLGKNEKFEFKFNKSNKDLRVDFLNVVKNCNFKIRAIVFAKDKIYSNYLRSSKDSFYNFALNQILKNNGDTINHAKIRLDGSGDKMFRQNLVNYLKVSLNSEGKQVMKNLRFRDSQKDVLIQLSDMVAGSIRRFYDQTKDDHGIYRKILKNREENVWEFK